MKKLNSLFLSYVLINICALLLASFSGHSQDLQGNRVITRQSFYLKDYWLTGVTRDTALLNDANKFPTSKAVYDFVVNRTLGGGGGGGSMVYPGAGIPLSTGSAWGTSITNNSGNWNTAFGWGDHASAGYLSSVTAATTYFDKTTSQSAYTIFGRGSGSGIPSFLSLDSSWLTGMHTKGYYDGIYATIAGSSKWTLTGSNIYYNGGNVGIGSSSPGALLEIKDGSFTTTASATKGILLDNPTTTTTAPGFFSPSLIMSAFGGQTSIQRKTIWKMAMRAGSGGAGGTLFFDQSYDGGAYGTVFSIAQPNVFVPTVTLSTVATINTGTSLNITGSAGTVGLGGIKASYAGTYQNAPGSFHQFTGSLGSTGAASLTGQLTYFDINPTVRFTTGGSGGYEGARINVVETNIPAGQNYLFRAGTGGGSFSSKFDITNNGQVIVGTATPDASASLKVESTTQGVLLPRMTTTQKNAIASPAEGLEVYDLTLHQKSYYNGTTWVNY